MALPVLPSNILTLVFYGSILVPLAIVSYFDIIESSWKELERVRRNAIVQAWILFFAVTIGTSYVIVQWREGNFEEVGSVVVATVGNGFLAVKIVNIYYIVGAQKTLVNGALRQAEHTLNSVLRSRRVMHPELEPVSRVPSYLRRQISSALFDDQQNGDMSARIKWLRPSVRGNVKEDGAEELCIRIGLFLRLGLDTANVDMHSFLYPTSRLVSACHYRVSLGKTLRRLMLLGTSSDAASSVDSKKDMNSGFEADKSAPQFDNPVESILLNQDIFNIGKMRSLVDRRKDLSGKQLSALKRFGVQLFKLSQGQSDTQVAIALALFPQAQTRGVVKNPKLLLMEIAVLLILCEFPREMKKTTHDVRLSMSPSLRDYYSVPGCERERKYEYEPVGENDWPTEHDWKSYLSNLSTREELADACTNAIMEFWEAGEWRRRHESEELSELRAAPPDMPEFRKEFTRDKLDFKKTKVRAKNRKHLLQFLNTLHLGFCNKGARTKKSGWLLNCSIYEIVTTARLAGRVASAVFGCPDEKKNAEEHKIDINGKPGMDSFAPDRVGAHSLLEAMHARGVDYCSETTLMNADIVWGLAGLVTQLQVDVAYAEVENTPTGERELRPVRSAGPLSQRADDRTGNLHACTRWKHWENRYPLKRSRRGVEDREADIGARRGHGGERVRVMDIFSSTLWRTPGHYQGHDRNDKCRGLTTMIESLRDMYLKNEDRSPWKDVSPEMWLLEYEKPRPCPSAAGALASFAEMAVFLAEGVMDVIMEFNDGHTGGGPHPRLWFPEDFLGGVDNYFQYWMQFKAEHQGRDTPIAAFFAAMDEKD